MAAEPSRCLRQKQARRSRGSRPNMRRGPRPAPHIWATATRGSAPIFTRALCVPQGKSAKRKRQTQRPRPVDETGSCAWRSGLNMQASFLMRRIFRAPQEDSREAPPFRVAVPCFCCGRRSALAKSRPRPLLRFGCFCRRQRLSSAAPLGQRSDQTGPAARTALWAKPQKHIAFFEFPPLPPGRSIDTGLPCVVD